MARRRTPAIAIAMRGPVTAAGGADPWCCPECGSLWEPLPVAPTPRTPARIHLTWNGIVIVGFTVAGAVLLSALAISVTAFTVLIGVGGLALVALMSWGLIRTWND
ncbi:hypothetical protein [Nonomuraea sp. NPDC049709]|uniref:hypothetical protein n=1 Tax=Nonomuraea sp. NPDC049709 TaxID=3154736 RepID=UPI00343503AE